ncbi:MAG: hypothetical protein ABI408_06450, partial [Gemmatimonadaceae bacterium]
PSEFIEADHAQFLAINDNVCGTRPDLLKGHAVDIVEKVNSVRRLSELRHDPGCHQRVLVNHLRGRAEILHCDTKTTHSRLRSPIQEINIASRSNHSMNAEGVAPNEHEIDASLVETRDEIEEILRQDIVVVAPGAFAHRRGCRFGATWSSRRPAEAIRYACFETCATDASRFDFER